MIKYILTSIGIAYASTGLIFLLFMFPLIGGPILFTLLAGFIGYIEYIERDKK